MVGGLGIVEELTLQLMAPQPQHDAVFVEVPCPQRNAVLHTTVDLVSLRSLAAGCEGRTAWLF